MKNLDKIGFIILFLVWPVSYYLKYIDPVNNQIFVDYLITFGYCAGTSIIAYHYGRKQKNWPKHLFYYSIAIFGIAIILTYLIDLAIDDLFGTTKVIWSFIITISICIIIYLFGSKY